jgi:hypothetical protein
MSATITVTATVQDPSGTALAGNSFVRFRLRNFTGFVPQVSGTSILPEIQDRRHAHKWADLAGPLAEQCHHALDDVLHRRALE